MNLLCLNKKTERNLPLDSTRGRGKQFCIGHRNLYLFQETFVQSSIVLRYLRYLVKLYFECISCEKFIKLKKCFFLSLYFF